MHFLCKVHTKGALEEKKYAYYESRAKMSAMIFCIRK